MGRLQRRLGPNGLGELREMRFEFSFNLIGKLTMDFLKAYHCAYSNRRCLADGLNQSVVSSVAQATFFLIFKKNNILPTDTYIRASKNTPFNAGLVEAYFPRGTTNQKHYPNLVSDASPVWNFYARLSDVISRGNQWLRCEKSAVSSNSV